MAGLGAGVELGEGDVNALQPDAGGLSDHADVGLEAVGDEQQRGHSRGAAAGDLHFPVLVKVGAATAEEVGNGLLPQWPVADELPDRREPGAVLDLDEEHRAALPAYSVDALLAVVDGLLPHVVTEAGAGVEAITHPHVVAEAVEVALVEAQPLAQDDDLARQQAGVLQALTLQGLCWCAHLRPQVERLLSWSRLARDQAKPRAALAVQHRGPVVDLNPLSAQLQSP